MSPNPRARRPRTERGHRPSAGDEPAVPAAAPVSVAPVSGDRATHRLATLVALAAAPRRAVRPRLGAEGRLSPLQGAPRRDAGAAFAALPRLRLEGPGGVAPAAARAVRGHLRALRRARDPALARQSARRAVQRGLAGLWIGALAIWGWSVGFSRRELGEALRFYLVPASILAAVAILQFHGIYQPYAFVGIAESSRFAIGSLAGNVGDLAAAWSCRRSWRRPSSCAANGSRSPRWRWRSASTA